MQPLAERLRPQTLDDYIGQKHLVGEGAVIRRMIEQKRISSFILWGLVGTSGCGEDHAGEHHRQDVGCAVLHAECSDVGREGCA